MGDFFHYLKVFLLLFFHVGAVFLLLWGPYHHLNAFLLLFSVCWGLFAMSFFLCYFFVHVGVLFCFIGALFWLSHPLPKFWRGPMSVCPLAPMSNMQYNHSLTASCHFRDILKIVTKHFLIYISIWLTTFIFPKTERKQHNKFSNSKYCFLSIYGIYFHWKPMKSEYFKFLCWRNENTYINLV